MAFECISYEKDGNIAILTINRPEVRNALNAPLRREMLQALDDADADQEVRVLILTGAGEKAFAAGADIGELQIRTTAIQISPWGYFGNQVPNRLENMTKPTLAAINGYAMGGGLEVALACTLRIASENARMGLPEINLGIIPGNGGTQRLPRLIGKGRAMKMILTGEAIDAQEACRIGLVNDVVPRDQLMAAARELAAKLAAKAPLALMLAKQAMNMGMELSQSAGIEYEGKLFAILCGTADKDEGIKAFLEKRAPNFTGE